MSGSSLSRRAVLRAGGLVGAVGAAALGGCDLGDDSSSTPSATPTPDPDQALVEAARSELSGLILRLSATGGAAALVAVHRVQLHALGGDQPSITRRSRALSHDRVVTRERRAADRFTHWAEICGNGDLARVFAAVAAGIRMQPVLREAAS
ncbi:MAG TPA: hypothetical protein VHR35_09265 [Nocardioides sp.]|nr:hypothetical protein [Nocardioides sp.]